MEIRLPRSEEGSAEEFAEVIAALVKEGVKFTATTDGSEYVIKFTGGF